MHLGLLYFGSLLVLLVYSLLYGLTAKESPWLGAITSAAVIILGMLFHFVCIYMVIDFYVDCMTLRMVGD